MTEIWHLRQQEESNNMAYRIVARGTNMDEFDKQQMVQESITIEIQILAREYGIEVAELMRLLNDWAAWQNENLSWVYVNRN